MTEKEVINLRGIWRFGIENTDELLVYPPILSRDIDRHRLNKPKLIEEMTNESRRWWRRNQEEGGERGRWWWWGRQREVDGGPNRRS